MKKILYTTTILTIISVSLFAQNDNENLDYIELKLKLTEQCENFLSSEVTKNIKINTCNCMADEVFYIYSLKEIDVMLKEGVSEDKQEKVKNILDSCYNKALEQEKNSIKEETTEEDEDIYYYFGY